jgi:hypothetical protein
MAKASSETISEAGDFKVDEVSITTSTGLVVDLLGYVMHITFFESIETATITGNILLSDYVNLVAIGPIRLTERKHRFYRKSACCNLYED